MTTRRTVVKGPLVMAQDITKSNLLWHPSEDPSDGDPALLWTDSEVYLAFRNDTGIFTFETRDGRRVVRLGLEPVQATKTITLFINPLFATGMMYPGTTATLTCYMDTSRISATCVDPNYLDRIWTNLDLRTTPIAKLDSANFLRTDGGQHLSADTSSIDATGWTAGWYVIAIRFNEDGTIDYKIHPEDSPLDWIRITPYSWRPFAGNPVLGFYCNQTTDVASVIDIYEIRLDRA